MLVAPTASEKVKPVAQSVGKEKLGHTEETIVLRGTENRLRITLGAYHHVVLQVHAGLRSPGASRRIQPEGSIVLAGARRIESGGAVANPGIKRFDRCPRCFCTSDDDNRFSA